MPDTHRREWRADPAAVRRSLEESLERLGLDRVDTLYLHDPDESGLELAGAVRQGLESLAELREDGLVTRIGVGSKSEEALALAVDGDVRIDEVMCSGRWTLADREASRRVLPAALERGVDVVAVSVYSSGLLARARPTPDLRDEYGPVRPERLALAHALADVAERHGTDLPTLALQFPGRHPAVVAVAFGTGTPEHVGQSVARWDVDVAPEAWVEVEDVVAAGGAS
ncbi:aldo/keto reductase [Litorihabitans aurantiacus]|uniref:NADP-dependent oxidoreductase domain-containing protein n=1 Tax=Litorihabitans aurantiacus TaxID=1930061 RepID=A0AA38CUA1_9MICO|nr:aldo/keto reductase [Litorihabitans aurantiacus]GMA31975.1 hypothetical protein GCM10025875_19670 [Litorihabitans aurantiacus]